MSSSVSVCVAVTIAQSSMLHELNCKHCTHCIHMLWYVVCFVHITVMHSHLTQHSSGMVLLMMKLVSVMDFSHNVSSI
jgi:hypothetical protein